MLWRYFCLMCVLTLGVRADYARDLAAIHTELIGGREKIAALQSLKAVGQTRSAAGELSFVMYAARPNQVRIEVSSEERSVVQGWDGAGQPWAFDSKTRKVVPILGAAADAFKQEAEFDDPLVAGPDRKVSLDYVGEVETEGRTLLKIVVTINFTGTSYVFLDPTTYLIVRCDVVRRSRVGEVILRTDYSDFKSVQGVILPHRQVVSQAGKKLRETIIVRMEPNPILPSDTFTTDAMSFR